MLFSSDLFTRFLIYPVLLFFVTFLEDTGPFSGVTGRATMESSDSHVLLIWKLTPFTSGMTPADDKVVNMATAPF